MSDDQLSQYQELTEKADELEEKIAARKAAEASLAKNKKRKRLSASSGRQTDPDGGEGRIGATVHQNFKDDPNKGYRTPREFMMDVMEVGLGHKEPDERLTYLAAAGTDEHTSASNPDGAFLVPVGFSPTLLQIEPEGDPMAGRTRSVPMTSPKIGVGARVDKNHSTSVSGGLVVGRKAQTAAAASSKMELEKIELTADSLFGYSHASEELLTDSPLTYAALLAAGFSDQFNSHIIN